MMLRYCCNLKITPDFSEITNIEELSLEGCVNLSTVHPSIGMLNKLVVLNMKDCTRVRSFPSKVEMDSLQVLNLSGCVKVDKLSEDLGKIKSLTELHIDRTSITELPLFGQQESNRSRWWTIIRGPFGLLSKQQHPQRLVSLAGLHMLKYLNFSYCNLLEVPESIGGLSCLERLDLKGNNFTSLPGSLSQLSHLEFLEVDGCKKLEVLPELPPSVFDISASHCTSLREVSGVSKDPDWYRHNNFLNCPKLFKNVTIDSEGSISKTQCLDSSITSQGSIHQLSAFLRFMGFRCEFFFLQDSDYFDLDITYSGNSIPEWFKNRSMGNHVKVELPSDWCFNKFRGYGTCVLFKRKKPCKFKRYCVKNFDGASLGDPSPEEEWFIEPIKINESYMIWLHYKPRTFGWEKAKNLVTFCFEENNEDIEVMECGARVVCDKDLEQLTNLSMFQDLPTLSQHDGDMSLIGSFGYSCWSWS